MSKKIEFEDQQQDLLWMVIDDDDDLPTVLDAGPFHHNLYNGWRCLNVHELAVGERIVISKSPKHPVITITYPIALITEQP